MKKLLTTAAIVAISTSAGASTQSKESTFFIQGGSTLPEQLFSTIVESNEINAFKENESSNYYADSFLNSGKLAAGYYLTNNFGAQGFACGNFTKQKDPAQSAGQDKVALQANKKMTKVALTDMGIGFQGVASFDIVEGLQFNSAFGPSVSITKATFSAKASDDQGNEQTFNTQNAYGMSLHASASLLAEITEGVYAGFEVNSKYEVTDLEFKTADIVTQESFTALAKDAKVNFTAPKHAYSALLTFKYAM